MSTDTKFWIGFGDIHEDLTLLDDVPHLADADGVIISGDITNGGGQQRAGWLLAKVAKINPNIYALIGNMDHASIIPLLDDKGWNIHAKGRQLAEGVGIVGVGFSTPTPFMTPSEVSDEKLGQWLGEGYEYVRHLPKLIVVAHDPPYGSKAAQLPYGENVGNRSVREFIENVQPDICITGHIHEATGEEYIGNTKVINPGMFCMGGYVRIQLIDGELEATLMYI